MDQAEKAKHDVIKIVDKIETVNKKFQFFQKEISKSVPEHGDKLRKLEKDYSALKKL